MDVTKGVVKSPAWLQRLSPLLVIYGNAPEARGGPCEPPETKTGRPAAADAPGRKEMDLPNALAYIRIHFEDRKAKHPETKTAAEHLRLLGLRVQDLSRCLDSEGKSWKIKLAGKRALQIAALALRCVEDLDLPLTGAHYHVEELPHLE